MSNESVVAIMVLLLCMHVLLAVMSFRLGQIRDMMRDERDRRKGAGGESA